MTLPSALCCPLCQALMQSAVKLPCCDTAACRACALKKLTANRKQCWRITCGKQDIAFGDLVVYGAMRMQIEQFRNDQDSKKRKLTDQNATDSNETPSLPKKKAKKIRKPKICNLCSAEGHTHLKCPLLCRVCSKFGHPSSHCPTITCKRCNLAGHSLIVCTENKVEVEAAVLPEEKSSIDSSDSLKEASENESSRNSLGCAYSHEKDDIEQSVNENAQPKEDNVNAQTKKDNVNAQHCSEVCVKTEPVEYGQETKELETHQKDSVALCTGERECICLSSDLQKPARPSKPCSLCPIFMLVAEHDVQSRSPAEIIGGVTILVQIRGLGVKQPPEYVKMFQHQEQPEHQIIANGLISSVLNNNLVFVSVLQKCSKESIFSVKKGDMVGLCQTSSRALFQKYKAVKNMPEEIDSFICTADFETVLEPSVTTMLKLRISTVEVNTEIHKPLIGFRRFSAMIKQWRDIKIKSKRISLQSCKFAYLPVQNVSRVAIRLTTGTKFGIFEHIENMNFFQLRVKTERIPRAVESPSITCGEPERKIQRLSSRTESIEESCYSACSPSSSMFSPVSETSPRDIKPRVLEDPEPNTLDQNNSLQLRFSLSMADSEEETRTESLQILEGKYGIVMLSIEKIKHLNKEYLVKISCFSILPNNSQEKFFTTSIPDFGEEMLSSDLKRILSIEKVYNCGHAPPHQYTYNCPAYGAALCCQDEKGSLNLFCQFLKKMSTHYKDGLVLVTYSNSDTIKVLVSKLKESQLYKEFNSVVIAHGDIETVIQRKQMIAKDDPCPHLNKISDVIACFQLGPLIPNSIPFEMWRVVNVILKDAPNFENFIQPYCTKIFESIRNPGENIVEPSASLSLDLHYDYQPTRTIKIEKVEPEVICIDSDSDEEPEKVKNEIRMVSPEPEKEAIKLNKESEVVKTQPRTWSCNCYDNGFHYYIQKCHKHTSYKLTSLTGVSIPPGHFGTFIASIESPNGYSVKAVKIFRPAGCPVAGQCIAVPSTRNVYDAKVFVTMKNDSSEAFEVVTNRVYAIANELLPQGSNIGKSDVLSTHSALSTVYQELVKNESQTIRCELKPSVEPMTLVQLQKPPNTCILDETYFTVQPGSSIYVPLKNIGKKTVAIKIGSQIGKITHVQHGKGIDNVLNPNFKKVVHTHPDYEQRNENENPAKRHQTIAPCLHEALEEICFECPMFHLVTITPVTIQPGGCEVVITQVAVLEDFPDLSSARGLHKSLRIHQSWQVEQSKPELSIKVLNKRVRVIRISQKNYVALSVLNESKRNKLTIDDKFVLARGQEIPENKADWVKTRYAQGHSVDLDPFVQTKVKFDPVEYKHNFEHAAVLVSGLNTSHKPIQVIEGIVPILPDRSIQVMVKNTSNLSRRSGKGNLLIEVDFDIFKNLNLPLVTFKDAYLKNTMYSYQTKAGNSSRIKSLEKIASLDNFPELGSLTKVDFMPNRITTVLVKITGCQGNMQNVKIIDGGKLSRFKHLKIIENVQPIFLDNYVFLSVKNFGHTSILFEDQHNSLANCLYTSKPASPLLDKNVEYFCTVVDDLNLAPNEESTVECCFEYEPEVDALLSLKCDSKGIKILKEHTTSEWSSKLRKNIINVFIFNSSKSKIFLKKGKVFCKANSLKHRDFVSLTVKLAEESTEEILDDDADDTSDYKEYLEYLAQHNLNNHVETVEEYSDDEKFNSKAQPGQLNYHPSDNITCLKCSSIQKIHLKCTRCLLFPLETVSDTVLEGFGATTILVKATFPKDHKIEFVQTFMSNDFQHIKLIHKGIGFGKNVVRKVFDGQYLFVTLFDNEFLKGLKIKKGFHIGDAQVRSKNAYKAAVPTDLDDTKFPVRTDSEGEILPHDSRLMKMKVEYDLPQNKENAHQLFRFVAKMNGFNDSDLSLPNVFTVTGCRYSWMQVNNLGFCKQRVSNKIHVGFCTSLINEAGVKFLLKLIEQEKEVKIEDKPSKFDRKPEADGNIISSKDVCKCMSDRSTESPDCVSCPRFTLRAFKGVFIPANTAVTFLAEMNLPDDKHMYRFIMVYPKFDGISNHHRELFKSRFVFVSISAEKEDLWIKAGQVVGFCQLRTKSPALTRLSPEVTYDVYVNSWSPTHLLPKEMVEIRLSVTEFSQQYTKTSTNRHELMKFTKSVWLNPHLKLELQPPEITLQNMNLISISLRNTSSDMVVLPTNSPVGYVTTLLSLDHVEDISKRTVKEQPQKVSVINLT